MKRLLVFALLVGLGSASASAQSPPPQDDPAKVALGGEIFDLFIAKQDYQARMKAIAQIVLKNEPTGAQVSADAALANVGKVLEDMRPAMRDAYAEAYARHFSLVELQTIKAFYESSAGQELLTEQPMISKEVLSEIAPEMISRVQAMMGPSSQPVAEPSK